VFENKKPLKNLVVSTLLLNFAVEEMNAAAWIATEVYFKHQEKNLENTALQ